MGDAGAYVIGHILVWVAISIVWSAPDVTLWAILLIIFWPIADALHAIVRRLWSGKSVFEPDRMHFHQLVMRALEITALGKGRRRVSNPLATLITLPFAISPMIAGVMFATDRAKSLMAFGLLLVLTYQIGVATARNRRLKIKA